jgi:hypothetical protein
LPEFSAGGGKFYPAHVATGREGVRVRGKKLLKVVNHYPQTVISRIGELIYDV